MKNHFNTPERCPAYNFYKADEDIKYLLVDQSEKLNDVDVYELNNTLIELKEWFNKSYNEANYNKSLGQLGSKTRFETKLIILTAMLNSISGVGYKRLDEFMTKDNLDKFKDICKAQRVAYVDLRQDMVNILDRTIKGVTNDYNRLIGKFEDRNVNFNYVKECLKVCKVLGLNKDPLAISLVEWLEMIKLADELV